MEEGWVKEPRVVKKEVKKNSLRGDLRRMPCGDPS